MNTAYLLTLQFSSREEMDQFVMKAKQASAIPFEQHVVESRPSMYAGHIERFEMK